MNVIWRTAAVTISVLILWARTNVCARRDTGWASTGGPASVSYFYILETIKKFSDVNSELGFSQILGFREPSLSHVGRGQGRALCNAWVPSSPSSNWLC